MLIDDIVYLDVRGRVVIGADAVIDARIEWIGDVMD